MHNVIDLFAGAGGLSLGASRAGFNVIAAVEIDPHAIATHASNFPNSCHIQQDIMKLDGETILNTAGIHKEDVIGVIGGPPCQGFSSIGHGNIDDNRNALFVRFFELVKQIHPAFFLAENVPGIMKTKFNDIRKRAFDHVSRQYHLLPPIQVKANEYGAPTTRTRYFFIGFCNDLRIQAFSINDIERMKISKENMTTVKQALEGLPANIIYYHNSDGLLKLEPDYTENEKPHMQSDFFYKRTTAMRPDGIGDLNYIERYEKEHIVNGFLPTQHTNAVRCRYANLTYGQRDHVSKSTKLDPDGFCPTLRSGTGPEKGSYQAVRPVHYQYARVINPREAARLQGFPDWYKLPDTIWHSFRQIGNSVSPITAELILHAIFQKLTK